MRCLFEGLVSVALSACSGGETPLTLSLDYPDAELVLRFGEPVEPIAPALVPSVVPDGAKFSVQPELPPGPSLAPDFAQRPQLSVAACTPADEGAPDRLQLRASTWSATPGPTRRSSSTTSR